MHKVIMLAMLVGCSSAPPPPAIRPVAIQLFLQDGKLTGGCADQAQLWSWYSNGAVESSENGCIVPRLEHQRFVLQSMTCTAAAGEGATLNLAVAPAGYPGASIDLAMTLAAPTVAVSFGAGLPTDTEVEVIAPVNGGQPKCLVTGYFTAEDGPLYPSSPVLAPALR